MKKSLFKRQQEGRRVNFNTTKYISTPADSRSKPSQPRLTRDKTLNINWHDPVDWAVIGAGLALLILLVVFLYHFSHDVSAILISARQ